MVTEGSEIGEFRLVNCIAEGSVSQIWEATHLVRGSRHAMKLLLPKAFKISKERSLLRYEYTIAKKFDHPNIIRAESFFKDREYAFYLMEYFGSPDLKNVIRANLLTVHSRIKRLTECIALALGHMHEKGLVHKDIKPANILMSRSSEVRVIDFSLATKVPSGLAKLLGRKTKVIQGTRAYIAPEVIKKQPADPQSDIYSFGVTIFECLTGRQPFMGGTPNELLVKHISEVVPTPSDFNENVAPEMDQLVKKMMAKDPGKRPQGIGELLSELRSVTYFKEPPEQLAARKKEEKEAAAAEPEVGGKIDSRADAERSRKNPSQPKEPVRPKQVVKKKPPETPKQTAPPQQVAPPQQLAPPPQTPPPVSPPQTQKIPPPPPPPPAKKPEPPQVDNDDDLPFADELPDFV